MGRRAVRKRKNSLDSQQKEVHSDISHEIKRERHGMAPALLSGISRTVARRDISNIGDRDI